MQKLQPTELEFYLNQPQKVARRIGSTKYQGWRCCNCSENSGNIDLQDIHLLIVEFPYQSKASNCPSCKELTITEQSQKIIKQATQTEPGYRQKISTCKCCGYTSEKKEVIANIPPFRKSPRRKKSRSGNSGSGSYGDYESFGGGFGGSSSSDFGSGDSGGGGAGDGW